MVNDTFRLRLPILSFTVSRSIDVDCRRIASDSRNFISASGNVRLSIPFVQMMLECDSGASLTAGILAIHGSVNDNVFLASRHIGCHVAGQFQLDAVNSRQSGFWADVGRDDLGGV